MSRIARRGFTLVEILVVLAIIGLLLGILVPAVGRARGQADVVACSARLRGLCLAGLLYAEDHDGRLAVDPAMLGPSHQDGQARNGGWIDNPHLELLALLRPHVETAEMFYCAGWKDPRYAFTPDNVTKGELGYFYFSVERQPSRNGSLSTFLYSPRAGDPMQYPRRLLNTLPGATWVASDLWFSGKSDDLPMAHRWYGKGVNHATLDGAVTMVRSSPRQVFR